MDPLLRHLADWKPFKALVVGDFMLDQFHYGDADRLSPDAPVPVLRVTRQEDHPGGAANLCLDLVAMRGRVFAMGVVGQDREADLLRTVLLQKGVDAGTLVADPNRPTTVKRNLIGLAQGRHPQKMFRVDFESRALITENIQTRILETFKADLKRTDIVCIEDYNKGVCTPELCKQVIALSRAAGKPVFVDPAPVTDFRKYKGATAITPNRTEATKAAQMLLESDAPIDHHQLATLLIEELELEAVVLTLDKQGALLLTADSKESIPIPTVAREVYDVTGAGDMMLAALAAARANKFSWESSVRFANAAAGLEVEVFGIEPIPLERIHAELLNIHSELSGKLRTTDELMVQVTAARKSGRRIVFTNGCFDVLHAGHVSLLERSAAMGDFLIVALNDDASVQRLKGPQRPINDQEHRARVIGALNMIDAVVLFEEDTPRRLIETVLPDVLVKGGDYSVDQVVGGDIVQRAGGRVELVDLVDGLSTSNTIERMKNSTTQN